MDHHSQGGESSYGFSQEPAYYTEHTVGDETEDFTIVAASGIPKVSLDACLTSLEQHRVPGPWFFRSTEFSHFLGGGALFNVYGVSNNLIEVNERSPAAQMLRNAQLYAIKRPRKYSPQSGMPTTSSVNRGNPPDLSIERHVEATIIETQVLSYPPFRNHPNIVKLLGWGLCLDDLEDPNFTFRIPHLILEKAECTLDTLLQQRPISLPEKRLLCIDVSEGLRALHDADLAHGVRFHYCKSAVNMLTVAGFEAAKYSHLSNNVTSDI